MNDDSIPTGLSNTIHSKRSIYENFLLIWVAASIDQPAKDYQYTLTQFQRVIYDVHTFLESNEAINFINEIHEKKIFFIIEDATFEEMVHLIHDIPIVDSIYIILDDEYRYEKWVKQWIKVRGTHTNIQSLCEALQRTVKQRIHETIPISFIEIDDQTTNATLNQLEPSFMYTQIFKEILLEMKRNELSIRDFISLWRDCNITNPAKLNDIGEFEHEYRPQLAIRWYTRECFVYQMLNQALRLLEGNTLINMAFFVRDLHQQIVELHREQINNYGRKSFLVYRGQALSETDFKKLQKTKGGLISFSNLLSTSKNRGVSLSFAECASTVAGMVGILFEMNIDPFISSAPFASIQDISCFPAEEEILFTMHTVFHIDEITKLNNANVYQVRLQLTSDDDQELRILTNLIRQEIAAESGWRQLGLLLIKIGQFDKAEQLYHVLLQQTSNEKEKMTFYNNLGYIANQQGDYKNTIKYYELVFHFREKSLCSTHPDLVLSLNNLATAYYKTGDYTKAREHYQTAIDILKKNFPSNHPDLFRPYNNIAALHDDMGEYSEALSFYVKARDILEKNLPSNHPDLATSYNNIAMVYEHMGKHSEALHFHKKGLEISQKTLSANHPDLAKSYSNVASGYQTLGDYPNALSFAETALLIREKTLASDHPFAQSYHIIAGIYHEMGEYSKALSVYETSIEIGQKSLSPNDINLAKSYNNIGGVYHHMGEYFKALSFYEKSLEIGQKILPSNHYDLLESFNNIGYAYNSMRDYPKALTCWEKARDIGEKFHSTNHSLLDTLYNNIGTIHNIMG